jgi:hypothetical protein
MYACMYSIFVCMYVCMYVCRWYLNNDRRQRCFQGLDDKRNLLMSQNTCLYEHIIIHLFK